jgi:hypothetical protein
MLTFPIALQNGQQILTLPGGIVGNLQMVLACANYPTAGSFTLEYQLAGGNKWRQIVDASADPFVGEVAFNVSGVISAIRLTFANLAGGSSCFLSITDAGELNGISGLVTAQDFFSRSSREGQIFDISAAFTLATLASRDTVVITGAKPVAIVARAVQFDGAKIEMHIYSGPTYTGGTLTSYFGMNAIHQNPPQLQFLVGATVSNPGTEIAAPKYLIGVSPSGQKAVQTVTIGGDTLRILAPNTTYLFRTTNTSPDTTNITTYNQWHEGDLSSL